MRSLVLSALLAMGVVSVAQARDEVLTFPINAALNMEQAKGKLDPKIKLFFGSQKYGKAAKTFGNFMTNKKTNAFGKSDEQACNWVFLSAVLELQERAVKEGGNAVVNIRGYYKKREFSSETEFQCGAGTMMAGVALTGDVVTLN